MCVWVCLFLCLFSWFVLICSIFLSRLVIKHKVIENEIETNKKKKVKNTIMAQFNEQVLAELSGYLEKTLSPDPNVRRPGITVYFCFMIVINEKQN